MHCGLRGGMLPDFMAQNKGWSSGQVLSLTLIPHPFKVPFLCKGDYSPQTLIGT